MAAMVDTPISSRSKKVEYRNRLQYGSGGHYDTTSDLAFVLLFFQNCLLATADGLDRREEVGDAS